MLDDAVKEKGLAEEFDVVDLAKMRLEWVEEKEFYESGIFKFKDE